jgi:hypothetical protein
MTNNLLGDVDATFNIKMSQYAALGMFYGSPGYDGYVRTISGDQIRIEFNANLTAPVNFIFITSHMSIAAAVA